ncbi:MAG: hypothetical protein RR051_05630 [Clostridiales bacterium]
MKKIMMILMAVLVIFTLTACGQNGLNESNSQLYQNEAGYQLAVPLTWKMESETLAETVFVSENAELSFVIINDLGSVEYYSLTEINDMLAEKIAAQLFTSYGQDAYSKDDTWCRQAFSGHDQAGESYVMDIYTYGKDPSINYYLVFCASTTVYDQQKAIIDDIIAGFDQTADAEELYQLISTRREAELAAKTTGQEVAPTDNPPVENQENL